jgi:MFS family permease
VAVAGFTFGAYAFQVPVYLQLAGLSGAQIASTMALAMIGGMVFQFPIGRYVRPHGPPLCHHRLGFRRRVVLSTLLAMTAGMSFTVLFVLMFLFGGVLMPLYSLVVAYANDHADPG